MIDKINVLDQFKKIDVCLEYKNNKQVYKTFEGQMTDITKIKNMMNFQKKQNLHCRNRRLP